jgi:hypothetical protein
MTAQPEALRLADALDAVPETGADPDLIQESAAELRRLHAQRDALLEALKEAAEALEIAADNGGVNFYQYAKEARAAIKAVEEGK